MKGPQEITLLYVTIKLYIWKYIYMEVYIFTPLWVAVVSIQSILFKQYLQWQSWVLSFLIVCGDILRYFQSSIGNCHCLDFSYKSRRQNPIAKGISGFKWSTCKSQPEADLEASFLYISSHDIRRYYSKCKRRKAISTSDSPLKKNNAQNI